MGWDNKDAAMGILRSWTNDVVPTRIVAATKDIAEYAVEKATEFSPFATGRFMASWRIGVGQDVGPEAGPGRWESEYDAASNSVNQSMPVISQIRLGQTFFLGNNTPYADYVEYGSPTTDAHYITRRVAQSIGAVYGQISLSSSVSHRFSQGAFLAQSNAGDVG